MVGEAECGRRRPGRCQVCGRDDCEGDACARARRWTDDSRLTRGPLVGAASPNRNEARRRTAERAPAASTGGASRARAANARTHARLSPLQPPLATRLVVSPPALPPPISNRRSAASAATRASTLLAPARRDAPSFVSRARRVTLAWRRFAPPTADADHRHPLGKLRHGLHELFSLPDGLSSRGENWFYRRRRKNTSAGYASFTTRFCGPGPSVFIRSVDNRDPTTLFFDIFSPD